VNGIGLTAVIPIRRIDESTIHIKDIISIAIQNGIKIILVVNCQNPEERLKMLNSFSAQYKDEIFLHSNQIESPGLARNIGIDNCKTQYITFWDADDLPEVLEFCKLTSDMFSNPQMNFGIGGFQIIDARTKYILSNHTISYGIDLERHIVRNPGIWRWIFKFENLGSVRFQEFPMGEDQDFIADLNPDIDEILVSDSIVYKYLKGCDSQLTNSQNAVDTIMKSIRYLTVRRETQAENAWYNKFLSRQLLTAIKRGSWRVKFEAILRYAKVAYIDAR